MFVLFVGSTIGYAQNTYPWPTSGNIGIGTQNPTTRLHIYQAAVDATGLTIQGNTINGDFLQHYIAITLDGDYGNGTGNSSQIRSYSNLYSQWGSRLAFLTTQGNVANTLVERMRIDNFGNVGVGTTTPNKLLSLFRSSDVQLGLYDGTVTNYGGAVRGYSVTAQGGRLGLGTLENNMYNERITIDHLGNVGIGTTNPAASLDVGGTTADGALRAVFARQGEGNSNNSGTFLGVRAWGTQEANYNGKMFSIENTFYGSLNSSIEFYRGRSVTGGFITFTTNDGSERVRIDNAGNVGIGTSNPTQKLSVNGTILAKEVIVQTSWSDYVFATDYKLASLAEVEQHIQKQGHLPGVPSAQEVAEKGVSVGDMQAVLLAKIEELTLHQIELEKRVNAQQVEILRLKALTQ